MLFRIPYLTNAGIVALLAGLWSLFGVCPLPAARGDVTCGVTAVYAAAKSLGVEANYDRLIHEEFISSRSGSTLGDLVRAAESLGLNSTPLRHLSGASLLRMDVPLVLHVASYGQQDVYNHWVLFLGAENGMARLYDGGEQLDRFPLADLLARWDGVALAIHDSPRSPGDFVGPEITVGIFWLAAFFVIASCAAVAGREKGGFASGLTFLLLTVGVGIVWSCVDKQGLLGSRSTSNYVTAAHDPKAFPEIGREELFRRMERVRDSKEFFLVDARFREDFFAGFIPVICHVSE